MRLLKLVLGLVVAALAVTLGLFAVVIVAVAAIAYFLGRMIVRRIAAPRASLTPAAAAPRARGRETHTQADVIEVTATEVRSDHASR